MYPQITNSTVRVAIYSLNSDKYMRMKVRILHSELFINLYSSQQKPSCTTYDTLRDTIGKRSISRNFSCESKNIINPTESFIQPSKQSLWRATSHRYP